MRDEEASERMLKRVAKCEELFLQGVPAGTVSRMTRLTDYVVGLVAARVSRRNGRAESREHWCADEMERLRTLRERGLSYSDIAKQLGRTHSATRRKIVRLGLKLPTNEERSLRGA